MGRRFVLDVCAGRLPHPLTDRDVVRLVPVLDLAGRDAVIGEVRSHR